MVTTQFYHNAAIGVCSSFHRLLTDRRGCRRDALFSPSRLQPVERQLIRLTAGLYLSKKTEKQKLGEIGFTPHAKYTMSWSSLIREVYEAWRSERRRSSLTGSRVRLTARSTIRRVKNSPIPLNWRGRCDEPTLKTHRKRSSGVGHTLNRIEYA